MAELPANFDQWVNDNNPSALLEYRKGWWDYIEILRRDQPFGRLDDDSEAKGVKPTAVQDNLSFPICFNRPLTRRAKFRSLW